MTKGRSPSRHQEVDTDYRAGKRCYTYQGHHIPGCMGCAVYGHAQCTCISPRREELLDKMNILEKRIAELEKWRNADKIAD